MPQMTSSRTRPCLQPGWPSRQALVRCETPPPQVREQGDQGDHSKGEAEEQAAKVNSGNSRSIMLTDLRKKLG